MVRQGNLARPGRRAAAHQGHGTGGVVRAAGRALGPVLDREAPCQAGHGRALQCLVHAHRRQDARKALRQHGLASTGRPHQEQAVAAGSGNFQRPPGSGLALHVGQVGVVGRGRTRRGLHPGPTLARVDRLRAEGAHHVEQVPGAPNVGVRHQGSLLRTAGRQNQARALAVQGQAGGERAAHRAQLARQRQLAGELPARQARGVDLAAGRQDAQRDRQVEAARILGQIGRREVDGDALVVRELQPGVLQRRAHALARLLHLHIRQTDQRETGQTIGKVHLDGDRGRAQPQQGAALHQSKTHRRMSPHCGARGGRRPAPAWPAPVFARSMPQEKGGWHAPC